MRELLLLLMLAFPLLASAQLGSWTLYYSDTEVVNSDGSVTITPTVSLSGNDGGGWCDGWAYDTPAVLLEGNAWAIGGDYSMGEAVSLAYQFPNATLPSNGSPVNLSFAGKVHGTCIISYYTLQPVYGWYQTSFLDNYTPGSSVPPGYGTCFLGTSCQMPFPPMLYPHSGQIRADLDSQQVGLEINTAYTKSQTDYTNGLTNTQATPDGKVYCALNSWCTPETSPPACNPLSVLQSPLIAGMTAKCWDYYKTDWVIERTSPTSPWKCFPFIPGQNAIGTQDSTRYTCTK